MAIKKITSALLILAQVLSAYSPLACAALLTPSFSEEHPAHHDNNRTQTGLSGNISASSAALQAEDSSAALRNIATGYFSAATNSQAQSWLSQFGTARVQLNVDAQGDWRDSAVDFLLPLYDDRDNVLFTQFGYRAPDGRHTGNIGVGWRTLHNDWIYGGNLFFDNDFTGRNRRIGFGAEAWTDFLKLSANAYVGITDWHPSRDFASYDERPATGWDIRSEAWLPACPQLGGHLTYQQYQGHHVALVDKNQRQHNPHAITAGLAWTPVPLLTAGVDYQTGSHGINDTRVSLMLRYQPGTSLREQLNPNAVRAMRSLAGSRYDLVERNNAIVLEYRKQELVTLTLPEKQSGNGGEILTLDALVTARYGVKRVEWQAPELLAAGGKLNVSGITTATVTLPPWQSGRNSWQIRAVAWDTHENASNTASTQVIVNSPAATIHNNNLMVTRDNALADGNATNAVKAQVTDDDGNPLAGQTVTFSASNGATITTQRGITDVNGVIRATLTSTTPGTAIVTASLENGMAASVKTHFTSLSGIILSDMVVTRNNALADGHDKNSVRMSVSDNNGIPQAGQTITVTATHGATVSASSVTTDNRGMATVDLTNSQDGVSTVSGTLSNGQGRKVDVTFEPLVAQAKISLLTTQDNALRDGVDKDEVEATVLDRNGNPVAGAIVTFKTQDTLSQVLTARARTDAKGKARTSVVSVSGVTNVIIASLENGNQATSRVNFLLLKSGFNMITNFALANGADANVLEVTLINPDSGQPAPGQMITLDTSDPMTLSTTQAFTDASGTATISVTSTVPSGTNGYTVHISNVACCSITYDGIHFR